MDNYDNYNFTHCQWFTFLEHNLENQKQNFPVFDVSYALLFPEGRKSTVQEF